MTYPCHQCNMDDGSPLCLQDSRCPSKQVTMLPRDQLARNLELQRAIEKVKAAGYDLVPRETLGCEGVA